MCRLIIYSWKGKINTQVHYFELRRGKIFSLRSSIENNDGNRMKIQIGYDICLSNLSKKEVRCCVRMNGRNKDPKKPQQYSNHKRIPE